MRWQGRFYFKRCISGLGYEARYGTQWSWDLSWDPGGERPGTGLVDQTQGLSDFTTTGQCCKGCPGVHDHPLRGPC